MSDRRPEAVRSACCVSKTMEIMSLQEEVQSLRRQLDSALASNRVLVQTVAQLTGVSGFGNLSAAPSPAPSGVSSLESRFRGLRNDSPFPASASAAVSRESSVSRKRTDSQRREDSPAPGPSRQQESVAGSSKSGRRESSPAKKKVRPTPAPAAKKDPPPAAKKTPPQQSAKKKTPVPAKAGNAGSRLPQQCIACGKYDVNRNIKKHFAAVHCNKYAGVRWILTAKKLSVLPEGVSLPEFEELKGWKGVKWAFMGLPGPGDSGSDDDDDGNSGNDTGDEAGAQAEKDAGNEADQEDAGDEIVTYEGRTMTRAAAEQLLYAGSRERQEQRRQQQEPEPEL